MSIVIGWIVITLLVAVLVGIIAGGVADEFGWGFAAGFLVTINLSLGAAVIFVAAHFIGKVW